MNNDMLKQIIIDTIKEEEHLGDNLKKQCVDYINELESQQANNCFFQGGRGSGKTYITKLEQQLSLYKDENIKYKNQQKEFIEWLIENESLDDYCNETTFTSIREKYEEIIGGKE